MCMWELRSEKNELCATVTEKRSKQCLRDTYIIEKKGKTKKKSKITTIICFHTLKV